MAIGKACLCFEKRFISPAINVISSTVLNTDNAKQIKDGVTLNLHVIVCISNYLLLTAQSNPNLKQRER